jgi:hypothetical protein
VRSKNPNAPFPKSLQLRRCVSSGAFQRTIAAGAHSLPGTPGWAAQILSSQHGKSIMTERGVPTYAPQRQAVTLEQAIVVATEGSISQEIHVYKDARMSVLKIEDPTQIQLPKEVGGTPGVKTGGCHPDYDRSATRDSGKAYKQPCRRQFWSMGRAPARPRICRYPT